MMRQGFQNKRESGKRGLIFSIFRGKCLYASIENNQCTFPSKKYMSTLQGSMLCPLACVTPLESKRYMSI